MLFLISILVWLVIFSTTYNVGVAIYLPLFISFFGLAYINTLFLTKTKIYVALITVTLSFFLISLLINSAEQSTVLVIFRYVFKAMIIPLLSIALLIKLYNKSNIDELGFSKVVIWVVLFQFMFVILQLTIPSFRMWFVSFIDLAPNWLFLVEMGHFRATGLAGISIYDTSVAYALLAPLYKPAIDSNKFPERILGFLSLLCLIILCMIAGRFGLLLLTPMLMYLYCTSKHKIFFCGFFVGLICVSILAAIIVIGWDVLYDSFRFIFEPFFALYETGELRSASTDQLTNEYLFFPDAVNPIIGDGFWAQPSLSIQSGYVYATDSGFLLLYIFLGPIGLLIALAWCAFYSSVINDIIRSHVGAGFQTLLNMVFFLSFTLLMIKAPFFFSEKISHTLCFLLSVVIYLKSARNNKCCPL